MPAQLAEQKEAYLAHLREAVNDDPIERVESKK